MDASLYIHIPVCLRKCDYCDFFSVPVHQFLHTNDGTNPFFSLVDGLRQEIAFRQKELSIDGWKTVYIGGGTPSLLPPDTIRYLCQGIDVLPSSLTSGEWTIEANPEDISSDWLIACKEAGINRLSLGIQSMQDLLLTGIGRRGSRESNLEALQLVKKHWKGRLSLDLISGLPNQTIELMQQDIAEILLFKSDHISLYSLTIEDGTPLEQRISKSSTPLLPDEDEATEIWIAGKNMLETHGYRQYEVSNFSLPGFESMHNRTYWNMDTYIGTGPGATGTVIVGDKAYRNVNTQNIDKWRNNPVNSYTTEPIGRTECIQEFLLMGMRLSSGISRNRFKNRFKEDILDMIEKTARAWQGRGFLIIKEDTIALTPDGMLFLNRFLVDCMEEICKKS